MLKSWQARILPIADRHHDFADKVYDQLRQAGFRVEKDFRTESLNKKIREAQLQQINYILVIGDKEVEKKSVNIRTRENEVLGERKIDNFIDQMQKEVDEKK